jgi:hypothetical protein
MTKICATLKVKILFRKKWYEKKRWKILLQGGWNKKAHLSLRMQEVESAALIKFNFYNFI